MKNSSTPILTPTQQNSSNSVQQYTSPPSLTISSNGENGTGMAIISQTSIDEPSITVGGYSFSGSATIQVYKASDDTLIDYLTHSSDGKQLKNHPDISKMTSITTFTKQVQPNTKIALPMQGSGIWYVSVKRGSLSAEAFVVRSDISVLAKGENDQYVFWGKNIKTGKSISDGVVILYNLQDSRKELSRTSFSTTGIANVKITPNVDIALFASGDQRAIVPLNFQYLNSANYVSFQGKQLQTRYFIFTDRPLYQPGDTMHYKAILRDDDDTRYTPKQGQAMVKIMTGYGTYATILSQQTYALSSDGTITGDFQIPADAKTGSYSVEVDLPNAPSISSYDYADYSSSSTYFDVEFYKKPEYSIDMSVSKQEVVSGDANTFTITGNYFSGQPLVHQKVKYEITSNTFYEYQNAADQLSTPQHVANNYWYKTSYDSHAIATGSAELDDKGQITIPIDTKIAFSNGTSQVFTITATLDDASQTPAVSQSNLLVYAGDYGIYRKDYSYGFKTGTIVSLPLVLLPNSAGATLSNISLNSKIHRDTWNFDSDKHTWNEDQEDLSPVSSTTDVNGNATLNFTPKKDGSYTLTVTGKDDRGNLVSKLFYIYASSDNIVSYESATTQNQHLSIHSDKQIYMSTDTAIFTITSDIPDQDIFLALERGRMDRYQIIHMQGKSGTVSVPLKDSDIPNMYVHAESFLLNDLSDQSTQIHVSANSKKLVIALKSNASKYGPGDTATVDVTTTDVNGNPISADVALWTVDKAIFQLAASTLGNIFDTFWHERYDSTNQAHSLEPIYSVPLGGRGGGCFDKGTPILMADGTTEPIEKIKIGDQILTRKSSIDASLVKSKVTQIQKATDSGYLIINGSLRITPDHILWINNGWKEAGSIQIGDTLISSQGKKIDVSSIAWQQGKFDVYNLDIQTYHTFFANGIWVHNDKGAPRQVFKDTAYWNPSIHTDTNGKASISFRLPDNLTTWTVAAVGDTTNTVVGQTTQDIIVTKNVIIRPILPNIIRQGDALVVSALVQNFTDSKHNFTASLKFTNGDVTTSPISVDLKSNEIKQLYWTVKATTVNNAANFTFSLQANDSPSLSDTIVQTIPVQAFEFSDKQTHASMNDASWVVKLSSDDNLDKTHITISLSSSIVGMLPTGMTYLIDYPWECVEQTTSRFVSAVIAKENPTLFADALKDKNIDDILQKGIARLTTLQQGDGGWSWWYDGHSDPFVTAYATEYLLRAQKLGVAVPADMLQKLMQYVLQNPSGVPNDTYSVFTYPVENTIAQNYSRALLGDKKALSYIENIKFVQSDALSLYVMTNIMVGNTDPQKNGFSQLLGRAKKEGDTLYWDSGDPSRFGSRDASTALAIRALLMAGGERDTIAKAVLYLVRNRKHEYWSNTFATAQVIEALTEYAKTRDELTPNETYTVTIDGKVFTQGNLLSAQSPAQTISIPASQLKKEGSKISIVKQGQGQIYSTFIVDEDRTDRHAQIFSNGLTVKREYYNEKGPQYSIGVGDIVDIKLTVSGMKNTSYYGVIQDELPAGLVPINYNLLNSQIATSPDNYYYGSYDVTDNEVTQNGMILSLYKVSPSEKTYTYKARAVSEGTYSVPPAIASLMYAPEVYGRSATSTVTISKEAMIMPVKAIEQISKSIAKTVQKSDSRKGIIILVLITLLGLFTGIGCINRAYLIPFLKKHMKNLI